MREGEPVTEYISELEKMMPAVELDFEPALFRGKNKRGFDAIRPSTLTV